MIRKVIYLTPKSHDPFSDIDIRTFLELRPKCEVKGRKCQVRASQRHHGMFRKDKRYPQLNVFINYQPTCRNCHTETCEADATENKYAFYERQCERYGKERVDGWIESLPLKCKDF